MKKFTKIGQWVTVDITSIASIQCCTECVLKIHLKHTPKGLELKFENDPACEAEFNRISTMLLELDVSESDNIKDYLINLQ